MASRAAIAIRKEKALTKAVELAEGAGGHDAEARLARAKRYSRDPSLNEAVLVEEVVAIWAEAEKRKVRDYTPIEGNITGLALGVQQQMAEVGITTKQDLLDASDAELLAFNGMGPTALRRLKAQL